MRRNRLITRKEGGQSLVEMALVLPVLLLILLGIVEFGRVGHCYLTLNYAAREGARIGITGISDQAIIERINDCVPSLNKEELIITLSPSDNDRWSGGDLAVTLDYSISFFIPFVDVLLPNPLPLQGKAIMRME